MPPRTPSPDQPPTTDNRRRRQTAAGQASEAAGSSEPREAPAAAPTASRSHPAELHASHEQQDEEDIAGQLDYRDAQTALELSLAELQAPDLDVEEMAGLYRRASRYADRCEQLLQRVEQEVMQWDARVPLEPPQPYQP